MPTKTRSPQNHVDFPGCSGGGSLEEISCDDFFHKFDNSKPALVYPEHTADSERNTFNTSVKRPAGDR